MGLGGVVGAGFLLALGGPAQSAPPVQGALRGAVDRAIQKVYPALVRIHVVSVEYGEGREVKGESAGSGVIISPEGYVITNHHVAGKAKRIRCTLADREELDASLVGTDPLADIAVLKLHLSGGEAGKPLPSATFGDSDRLRVGDPVLAMGSPLALSQSVTMGIVSNTEMTMPRINALGTFKLDGEETGSIVNWIGHDAQIFPGNSGGPLVNLDGEIVGINEISLGLGGAIPGKLAKEVAEEIIRHGSVTRSWLGLSVQPLLKGQEDGRGALVSSVVPGSPAEKAGLKAGDRLLAFGGRPLHIRYLEQLPEFNRLLLGTPVGSRVELVYARDGALRRAGAVTVARGAAEGEEAELKAWGMAVRDITLLAAQELRREAHSGILVSSLRPGAPAADAKPPLQPEDIIVELGGQPVRTVKDLMERARLGEGEKPAPVLVGFERRTQRLLTVVKPGLRQNPDRSAEAIRAWLPAATQVLTPDLAEALGLKGRTGVRVTQVYAGSTAEKAGLRVGDLLLRLDGQPIPASRPEEVEVFSALVRQYDVGAVVSLDLVRDGQPLKLDVALAASPASTRELAEYRDVQFDFSARDLTFQDRLQQALDREQSGALVTGVESGGWAALAQLAAGDIVLALDGKPIPNATALETYMKDVARRRPARVVFFVRRGVHTMFLEVEPAWGAR